MTSENRHAQRAVITHVKVGLEDHGIETVSIYLKGESWGQSFGNLGMDSPAESRLFVASLAQVFGCSPDALVGSECEALYPYAFGTIEGLRSTRTGRVFTIQAWRERQGYDAPTPLDAARARREREIEHLQRRLREEIERDVSRGYQELPKGEAP